MNKKEIVVKYSIFLSVILVVFPLYMAFFINLPSYVERVRATFLLSRTFMILAISSAIFLAISFDKLKKVKSGKENNLLRAGLVVLAVLLVSLSFYTYADFERNLPYYTVKDGRVNFDGGRWLDLGIMGEKGIFNDDLVKIKDWSMIKKLDFDPSVNDNKIIVFMKYESIGGQDSDYYIDVNDNRYDITDILISDKQNKTKMYVFNGGALDTGENIVRFSQTGDDSLYILTQTVYRYEDTYNPEGKEHWASIVAGSGYKDGVAYLSLYKLGLVFKIIAVVLIFLAIFGLGFFKRIIESSWKELLFSTVFAFIVFFLVNKIYNFWEYLSRVVAYSVFFLLKISFLNPILDFTGQHPAIGLRDFTLSIADTCSGVEGISFFLLIFTILIVIFWKQLDKKRVFLLYIPGVIGVYLVNIFRVYLIFLVARFISLDFAVNAFHTNIGMVLFIIYSLSFWYVALPWIMKKGRK